MINFRKILIGKGGKDRINLIKINI
jgi:hypothetical protein